MWEDDKVIRYYSCCQNIGAMVGKVCYVMIQIVLRIFRDTYYMSFSHLAKVWKVWGGMIGF